MPIAIKKKEKLPMYYSRAEFYNGKAVGHRLSNESNAKIPFGNKAHLVEHHELLCMT